MPQVKDFLSFVGFAVKSVLASLALFAAVSVALDVSGNWLRFPALFLTVFLFGLIYAAAILAVALSVGYTLLRITLNARGQIWIAAALQGVLATGVLSLLLILPGSLARGVTGLERSFLADFDLISTFALLAVPAFVFVGRRHYGRF